MKFRSNISKHTRGYILPKSSVTYWHTIRFALLYIMALQIITSIFLSAFYVPESSFAAYSILYLENEITCG